MDLRHSLDLDELNLAHSDVLEFLSRFLDDLRSLYLPEIVGVCPSSCYPIRHPEFTKGVVRLTQKVESGFSEPLPHPQPSHPAHQQGRRDPATLC